MSKRFYFFIAVAVILVVMTVSTARQQAALNRFDEAMGKVLAQMEAVFEQDTTPVRAAAALAAALPQIQAAYDRVPEADPGYRAKLKEDVGAFLTDYAKMLANQPDQAASAETMESVHGALSDWLDRLRKGPNPS